MKIRLPRIVLPLFLMLLLLPLTVHGADDAPHLTGFLITGRQTWTIAPGVEEEALVVNDTTGMKQNTIRILYLDLSQEGLELKSGYRNGDGSQWGLQTCTEQAAQIEAELRKHEPDATVVAAVNANFFNMSTGEPLGALVMDGKVIHGTQSGYGYFAVKTDGTAVIRPGSTSIGRKIVSAMGGDELLISGGVVSDGESTDLGPRTAVGIREDGTVLLVQVDGRQSPMACGVSRPQLAQIMLDLGCVDALNLDGGGSSTYCVMRPGGSLAIQNSISDGYERAISGSLLVVSHQAGEGAGEKPVHTHDWTLDETGTLAVCERCAEACPLDQLTGIVRERGTAGSRCYIGGVLQTGWTLWNDTFLHCGEDGLMHEAQATDRRTCTENGNVKATCATCGSVYRSSTRYPTGHTWNEAHVCTVCGKQGTDLTQASISGVSARYIFKGSPVRPTPTVRIGSTQLSLRSGVYGKDGFLDWVNSDDIGVAVAEVQGRGKYYGTLTKEYQIVPDKVSELTVTGATEREITLGWSSVPGADCYAIYEKDDDGALTLLSVTRDDDPSVCLGGFLPDSTHELVVRARATRKGVLYESYQDVSVTAKTKPGVAEESEDASALLMSLRLSLAGDEQLPVQMVDGQAWFFLPGCADMTALALSAQGETLTASGPLGTVSWSEGETLDLTGLTAPDAAGVYRITVRQGDRAAVLRLMRSTVTAIFLHSDQPEQGRAALEQDSEATAAVHTTVVASTGTVRCKQRSGTITAVPGTDEKRSYSLHLDEGADLINVSQKALNWALEAEASDPSMLQDRLYKQLGYLLALPYSPRVEWADLYYDGVYRGTYQISEINEVSKTAVNLSDTWLICLAQEGETGASFTTDRGKTFRVLHPENPDETLLAQIRDSFQAAEDAVYEKRGAEHLDLDSIGQVYLMAELSCDDKAFSSDLYFYLGQDGLWHAGPIWRSGAGFGYGRNNDPEKAWFRDAYLIEALMADPAFRQSMQSYYRTTFLPAANRLAGKGGLSESYSKKIRYTGLMNEIVWPSQALGQTGAAVDQWLCRRLDALYDLIMHAPEGTLPDPDDPDPKPEEPDPKPDDPDPKPEDPDPKPEDPDPKPDDPDPKPDDPIDPAPSEPTPVPDPEDPTPVPDPEPQPTAPQPTPKPQAPCPGGESCPGRSFTDMPQPGNWAHDPIDWAVTQAITQGTSQTTFSPDDGCTRAQVVTFLWRWAGEPGSTTKTVFTDIPDDAYYKQAVQWAVEQGITVGVEADRFGPNEVCTRCQVVTFLWRYHKKPAPAENQTIFADVETKDYFFDAVCWAYHNQIVLGTQPTRFDPYGTCTRAQIVTFLYRNDAFDQGNAKTQ